MFAEPGISALQMKPVIATGNKSSWLFRLDLIETYSTVGSQNQFFPSNFRQLVELRCRQPFPFDGLNRQPYISLAVVIVVTAGAPEQRDVDNKNQTHTGAGQEKSKEDGEKHGVVASYGGAV